MNKTFFYIFILCILIFSCSKQKDNKVFKGYQKGVWQCTDTTHNMQCFIFQDSIQTVIITPDSIDGSPEFFGKKNKAGVYSFFNFNTDPIELNQVYFNNDGKAIDTVKLFVQFIGKDTLQLTKKKGKEENYFKKTDTVFTYIKTDTISTVPQRMNDIVSTIYKLYSNFSYNMSAMDESINTEKIPVYGNIIELSFGLGMLRLATMNNSFDAENIRIIRLRNKEATVSYTLNIMDGDKLKKQKKVITKMRKINNEWRVYWKDIFGTGTL